MESLETCGAEVQKGNPPEERKIQRLMRKKEVTTLIKRCNDFGAGGVSVAIGELCDGLVIQLDKVPKKYEGLDGTELAISESQERMAVVVAASDADKFIAYANEENLEATLVADVTDTNRLEMYWRGKKIVNLAPCEIKSCSIEQKADFFAEDIKNLGEDGTQYAIRYGNTKIPIACKVPGQFSIMNSMQACAAALALGLDRKIIESSFNDFLGVCGRLERVDLAKNCEFSVYIDYAHTPDALQKLLETVNGFKGSEQRVVLLFGCGGDREQEKRKIMGSIATRLADFTVITSDNPRSEDPTDIINQILMGIDQGASFAVIPERKRAIEYAIATAKRGDIIVLAGKGHEKYEINANGRFPFDEREVIRETIEKYYERKK
jgi:UDP-N-acetylmuramyl-tripeptide synthetase